MYHGCYMTNLGSQILGFKWQLCHFLHVCSYCCIVVQSLNHIRLFATLWTAKHQTSLSFTITQSLLKLMSIVAVMLSNHFTLYCPLFLLHSIFPSIGIFSNELGLCIRWPNCWGFGFSFIISPSNRYSGLISFRIDWFDLLAVQRTLRSLLQHHNSKASVLWHLAFFMVQLSHPYMTTGKTITLTHMDLCWQNDVSAF